MGKLLEGTALEKRAKKLGIDIQGDAITQSTMGRHKRAHDSELQRRVIEAERSIRESRFWWLALISALASVVSAATAIIVVLSK
ncbi:MAG: hypothetical protein CO132_00930 [Candidatus Kerfeldbacteria bacterium CG_4_9_14_3_um_filter_45_8]|nr:MAG: hypothetical protein CO132_00930 [Candidatus Kerfeldbacteria bacterium CG_4_9_14_3_um_filter_45_8]